MPKAHKWVNPVFEHQAVATLVQAAPVQNTWYDILAETRNVRLLMIAFEVLTTGETLELRLIIDGITYTVSQAAVAGTNYYPALNILPSGTNFFCNTSLNLLVTGTNLGTHLEGRTVQVSLRKTTAAGAGNLQGAVLYNRIPDA